jgi:hypothetical protein
VRRAQGARVPGPGRHALDRQLAGPDRRPPLLLGNVAQQVRIELEQLSRRHSSTFTNPMGSAITPRRYAF